MSQGTPHKTVRLGPLLIAAAVALAVVGVAELAARRLADRVELAHSYDVPRNPNVRRAWVAFTEPRPRDADERLIILISNSQAYAPEIADPARCYAHLLERRLNDADPAHRYIVANWSVGGATGPEMLLLAARAVDHAPDLLMLVTHSNPFSRQRIFEPLSFYISDASQLAYHGPVRDRLPGWFLHRHDAYEPATFLEAHSGLVRLHDLYIESRDGRWERDHKPPRRPAHRRSHGAPAVNSSGENLLRTLARTFRKEQPDTPVLVVSMPLCEPAWNRRSWRRLTRFAERMQRVLADVPGVTVVDAVEAVDVDLFYTHTHMKPPGHRAFAGWLLPHVRAQLDVPPLPAAADAPAAPAAPANQPG